MATSQPPCKRYCKEPDDSSSSDDELVEWSDSSDFSGFDSIFPSDSETISEDSEGEWCFFPSEDNNQPTVRPRRSSDFDSSCELLGVDEARNQENASYELKRIGTVLISSCCDKFCLRHLTALDVINSRREISQQKSQTDHKRWLHDKLLDSSSETVNNGPTITKYFVAGKEICAMAWCKVYSLSFRTLQRMLQKTSSDHMTTEHGNLRKKQLNARTEAAMAWMKRYFYLVGDKMPDKDQIHLPCWETQKDIYYRYCSDINPEATGEKVLKISMFYKVWNANFSNVKIPEVSKINSITV